ncbi:phosphatidylinositol-glycan biosynthesis class S protein [Suillus spraguei]|nr:phosphatidylinositol-glycan biosynthesis class S protein [Suillus spraguei]KAG2363104.1 phosphatidylinositol-glycan biosynthesis class S protein [Suillus spraguei]
MKPTALTLATRLSSILSTSSFLQSQALHIRSVLSNNSDHYRPAFTLLNEDATSNRFVETWHNSFPLISRLSILDNFMVESQVQYYVPLAFEPKRITFGDTKVSGLTREDLAAFIDSAEWILASSVSNDLVLHFVLFAPSETPTHPRTLLTVKPSRSTNQSSFLLPQWGSIFILNNELSSSLHLVYDILKPVFRNFATQLAAPFRQESSVISNWQLDTAPDTLLSIVKLVDQINSMPVGQVVRDDVLHTLASLHEVCSASNVALSMASRAFPNPGMLALLYFSAKHKYVVYTPLFTSVFVPLVVALIRDFMAW